MIGRTVQYYRHRLLRTRQTTHQITAGLAIGVAVSFSPLLGTHFFESLFLAWCLRVSKLAAFVGTAIGNPLTFPFMFWADYKLGAFIFEGLGLARLVALPDTLSWHVLYTHPLELFLPMLLGSVILGLVFGGLAYAVLYHPVKIMQKAYRDHRHRK